MELEDVQGVYEALRSYRGVFALLPEHQERLQHSCAKIGVQAPDLASLMPQLEGEQRVRVSVLRDGEVKVEQQYLPPWSGSFLYEEIWRVKMVEGVRELPSLKHIHTEFQKERRQMALEEGIDEIVMVHDGFAVEGGITNVFGIKDDVLVTPNEGMLPGIGRELVLQKAEELGLNVELRAIAVEEWAELDGKFLTNSIRGIVAVDAVHPVMESLARACESFIEARIDSFKKSS